MRNLFISLVCSAVLATNAAYADEDMHEHNMMHHNHAGDMTTPLTEPGNEAFATIQEVVVKLLADPKTDWSRVNLEALRKHLVDMQNFTLNVTVSDKKNISNGVQFTVKATTPDAQGSLERLFNAHPPILKQESGWDMKVSKNRDGSFTARVTTDKPEDVAKIRGLGYIGLVAYGQHHQLHHWMMATGRNPHQGH
jgi:hypothetical protein